MAETAGRPTVTERVRQPLLERLTREALDDDYRAVADRRAVVSGAGAEPRPPTPAARGRRVVIVLAVVAVFGLLVSTAFVQTSRGAAANDASRQALIRQVEDGRQQVADQQEDAANLQAGNADLTGTLQDLGETAQTVLDRSRRLQASTGFLAVTGEGVRVTVTEVPGGDPNQTVKPGDLQLLVNALWQSGAEAISVNGQRFTTRSAIGSSGFAIEVNGVGVASPYTVLAIGDSRSLQGRFYETTSGLQFDAIANQFGFSFVIDNAGRLEIPAGLPRQLVLRSAEVIKPATPPGKDPDS